MSKKKEIIWDFDGVILLSDEVREYGFVKIFENYSSSKVKALIEFHRQNGGLSRYVKIRYFYEKILRKNITDEEVSKYANQFSVIMKKALVDQNLLNSEWLELMKKINSDFTHSIASGSDEIELNFLCQKLGIEHYFKVIRGSPIAKIELVNQIMGNSEMPPEKFVLIGDAINDREAAQENNIDFIGYRNPVLSNSTVYVNNLMDSTKFLY